MFQVERRFEKCSKESEAFFVLIEVELIHNIILISGVQHGDSIVNRLYSI